MDLERARNDTRIDFTNVHEITQDKIQREQPHQMQEENKMSRIEARTLDLKSELATLWREIFQYAQAYAHRCIETGFAPEWSIGYVPCKDLCYMAQLDTVTKQRERELRALKVERAYSRHQDDGQDSKDEIVHLERILKHMEKRRDQTIEKFMTVVVKPLLIANGRVEPSVEPSGSGNGTDSDEQSVTPDARAQETRSPEERYIKARNELIGFEEALESHELGWYNEEIPHLLAFTHSTREFYNALGQKEVRFIKTELAKAQVEFQEATEELLRLNVDLPPITEPSDLSSPRESGVGSRSRVSDRESQDRRRQRWLRRRGADARAKRDFVNRWQIMSKPEGSAMLGRSPQSNLSWHGTPDGSRLSETSAELTPSPTKRRRLKEYTTTQNDLRTRFADLEGQ
ncbi:hypothetical protein BST61_g9783 [Cercospora zeina]